jgi:integrase
MGRTFVKPSAQALRDTRLSVQKSYTPEQLRALWSTADAELKAWLVLGLLGALDNADIAHLTHDVVDRERGVIDYRRRKVGRVRRVIPLPPEAWAILDAYQRPAPADPADKNRFFLTPTGKPLQRTRISARGQPHTIDYVAMRWRRLLERVGLKPRTPRRRPGQPATPRRFKPRGEPAGQGFRALRTTFANLAPPGYRDEVEIIMGHSRGSVLVEHYVEQVGIERLAYVTASLWRLLGAETKPQTQTTAEAA